MHESLDEFKFLSDTTNSRVICPCTSEKLIYNVVNTLAPSVSPSPKKGHGKVLKKKGTFSARRHAMRALLSAR